MGEVLQLPPKRPREDGLINSLRSRPLPRDVDRRLNSITRANYLHLKISDDWQMIAESLA